jgi:hypothetical protein
LISATVLDPGPNESCALFLGGVPFPWDEPKLRDFFAGEGIRFTEVQKTTGSVVYFQNAVIIRDA